MNNSGNGALRVPGYGGIPIDLELPARDRFADGIHDFQQTPAITVRELAMTVEMAIITDEPDWHKKIFDDETSLTPSGRPGSTPTVHVFQPTSLPMQISCDASQ